jgi:hypothetical protein
VIIDQVGCNSCSTPRAEAESSAHDRFTAGMVGREIPFIAHSGRNTSDPFFRRTSDGFLADRRVADCSPCAIVGE